MKTDAKSFGIALLKDCPNALRSDLGLPYVLDDTDNYEEFYYQLINLGNAVRNHFCYTPFKHVFVPNLIKEKYYNITKPSSSLSGKAKLKRVNKMSQYSCNAINQFIDEYNSSDDVYVASGEQSFLQEFIEGRLKPGLYVTSTSCYRPWDGNTEIHRNYFVKAELIQIDHISTPVEEFKLDRLLLEALDYFKCKFNSTGISPKGHLKIVYTEDDERDLCKTHVSKDILLDDIEIGSYGIRSCDKYGVRWAYGTALAEPRFSIAMDKLKKKLEVENE